MALIRLLYRSDSELTGSDRAVREAAFAIADRAAVRNAADGVTGTLMFVGGVFVQLLEGEARAVENTFESICRDLRHRHLVLLDLSPEDRRLFEGHAMVAFEGDAAARRLFPAIGQATPFARRNPTSATAAIDLMRKLFAKRSQGARGAVGQRMIATDVMGQ